MKRIIVFTNIFLILIMGLIAFFGVKPNAQDKQLNNVSNDFYYDTISRETYINGVKSYHNSPMVYQYLVVDGYTAYYSNSLDLSSDLLTPSNHHSDIVYDYLGTEYVDTYVYYNFILTDTLYFYIGSDLYRILSVYYEYETDYDFDTGLINHFVFNQSYVYFTKTGYDYYFTDQGLPNNFYNVSYDYYYDKGYEDARSDFGQYFPPGSPNGFDGWYGYQDGYDYGFDIGFDNGIEATSDYSFAGLLGQVFIGLGSLLAINLLPGISLGAIIAVPVVFGIIAFIIGKRGGKGD